MSGDIVYADLQTVRTSPLKRSSPVPRPVSSNSSTAHKPCPNKDWKLHGGKCYWFATSKKSWVESGKDCAMKNSQLMVIRDFTDMKSIFDMYIQKGLDYSPEEIEVTSIHTLTCRDLFLGGGL
ncbi:C-type lectin like 1 [Phyllostomus discolor]|uniref:C-type lectin like 1 n=1 Tax=Phyllostomus discolor TaxID=89673 RepID=A0A834AYS0_9CHIR|nr:C-type lectin like 1 [Phyllostomus discolor]